MPRCRRQPAGWAAGNPEPLGGSSEVSDEDARADHRGRRALGHRPPASRRAPGAQKTVRCRTRGDGHHPAAGRSSTGEVVRGLLPTLGACWVRTALAARVTRKRDGFSHPLLETRHGQPPCVVRLGTPAPWMTRTEAAPHVGPARGASTSRGASLSHPDWSHAGHRAAKRPPEWRPFCQNNWRTDGRLAPRSY